MSTKDTMAAVGLDPWRYSPVVSRLEEENEGIRRIEECAQVRTASSFASRCGSRPRSSASGILMETVSARHGFGVAVIAELPGRNAAARGAELGRENGRWNDVRGSSGCSCIGGQRCSYLIVFSGKLLAAVSALDGAVSGWLLTRRSCARGETKNQHNNWRAGSAC
jgi:hypothetical protein